MPSRFSQLPTSAVCPAYADSDSQRRSSGLAVKPDGWLIGTAFRAGNGAHRPNGEHYLSSREQTSSEPSTALAFGFLTAVDSPLHGLFGGYLLVDVIGRPLEFHCTAPVKVSRAQQILYGSTLQSHLHGRQIGAALLSEGILAPQIVLTDLESMLHVRLHTILPVALVKRPEATACSGDFSVGNSRVSPPPGNLESAASMEEQEELLRGKLAQLVASVDLNEPFERIRAAIDEAQRH